LVSQQKKINNMVGRRKDAMVTYNRAASVARSPALLKKPRYGSIGHGPRNGSGRIHAPRRGIFKKIGKFFKHPKKTLTRALKSGGREAVSRGKATLDFLGGRQSADQLRAATKGSKFFDKAFKAYDKGKELHGQARDVSRAVRGGVRQFADQDLPKIQRRIGRAGSLARDQAAQAQAHVGQVRSQARQIGEGMGQAQTRMQSDVSQTVRELREAADALGKLGQDFRGGRSAGMAATGAGEGFGMRKRKRYARR
jgi:hypothetical protein